MEDEDELLDAEKEKYQTKIRQNALELQKNIQDIFQYMKARDIIGSYQDQCNLMEIPEIAAKIGRNLNLESLNIIPLASDEAKGYFLPLSQQAVELILEELLQNAQKFHPQQSPAVEVKISEHPNGITIQVADNGATLSTEQLSKMWNPYFQAEKSFSGQVPGMGLGLSMVASLIWSAGGACRAYNRAEGPGIVVELILPILQADAA
jgi:K+-sensing histidine kinase KdpD